MGQSDELIRIDVQDGKIRLIGLVLIAHEMYFFDFLILWRIEEIEMNVNEIRRVMLIG